MQEDTALNLVLDKKILTEEEVFEVYGPVVFHADEKDVNLDDYIISSDLTQKEDLYSIEIKKEGTIYTTAGHSLKATKVIGVILDPVTLKQIRDASTQDTQNMYELNSLDRSVLSGDQIVEIAKKSVQSRGNLVNLLTAAIAKNHIEQIVAYRVELPTP
ncbi:MULTISPECIES: hypothetical protein [Exiguobacterium]|uniref:hypothetical protein n=1 Tax=Exiguobacterium sp. UBA1053 TaxID=1946487 RepID=UPI0025BFE845|nr:MULTISPECIES: hypothetical protein [Exiguobacterium]